MTWKEAIQKVLQENGGAMHYADIAEQIAAQALVSVGANPAATVAATISQERRLSNSPFEKVGVGLYTLRSEIREPIANTHVLETATSIDDESETGALRAFGMYWQRDLVNWQVTTPKLFGVQSRGATKVNFAGQIGVYLLHDRNRVIYVGRATDNLVSRLRAHISDRLGGRWDRFSWFGLFGVDDQGVLVQDSVPWSQAVVIETLEALLIESLEPPLNRKRGDNFAAVEYLQESDPSIRAKQQEELLKAMAARLQRD